MDLGLKTHRLHQKALEYYCKGNCKKLLNDLTGAVAAFSKAIKYNPNFAEAYFRRADIRMILNDTDGAISDYSKAIELNPTFSEVLNKD